MNNSNGQEMTRRTAGRAGDDTQAHAPVPTCAHAYDYLLVPGGAEQVSLHLLRRHPDWVFYTGFFLEEALGDPPLARQRINSLARPVRHPARQALTVLRAFERHGAPLAAFDRVLFSGVYAPCGVRHRPRGGNGYYCHTPPRFAYDLEDWYLERARPWERPALRRLAAHVRDHYASALARMDRIATNSETVRSRLERFLGIDDAEVIHPPVDTEGWQWRNADGYYLSNARVEPYKRVEWAVRAFMAMPDRRLVVASGGSDLARLRALAGDHGNIRFTGWCSAARLRELTGRCIATLYLARDEDFGLSPIESMAAGKPVIGVAEGGLCETVVPGETGVLLDPELANDRDALCAAVRAMDEAAAGSLREACEARAARFAAPEFDTAMDRFMAALPVATH